MTPAESKTIRESWGLSVQGLAEIMDVDPRSVTAWEAGRIEVDSQLSCLEDMAKRAVAVYAEQAAEDGTVTLVRYRTDEDLWRFHPKLGSTPAYVTDGGWPTPAFYIFAKETQGAAWLQNTREKNGGEEVTVISASFDDPFLPAALSFMLWPRKDAPGCYDAVWRRPAVVKKPKHGFEIGGKQGFRR